MHPSYSSTQIVRSIVAGRVATIELPSACTSLGGGPLLWGDAAMPMTPAYWASQSWMWSLLDPDHYKLGEGLEEELLACMLGGYGIPAEVGLAAYARLRPELGAAGRGLDDPVRVHRLLSEPLVIRGRSVRYRFANQKARYVSAAFAALPLIDRDLDDLSLREALTSLKGVGLKTASWVVRNLRASDEVAILDVHVLRAGAELKLFDPAHGVGRDYREMEAAYLRFAAQIGTAASLLDSVIWMTMRQLAGWRLPPITPSAAGSRARRELALVA